MEKDWMALAQREALSKLLETNRTAEQFGLTLAEEDAELLLRARQDTLRELRRVEFGEGIAPQLIDEFCDSEYLNQDDYAETLIRLQEIFYRYKNEMEDAISDDELLHLMREQFEEVCFGDLDELEGTCLANFASAVRAGYRGYTGTDGRGEALRFDHGSRWDHELYLEALKALCWS